MAVEDTASDADAIDPTGTGCGFPAAPEAAADIARETDAPHPVNTEAAATAEKPRNTWRRESIGKDTEEFDTRAP
jgi:hypothetical protein